MFTSSRSVRLVAGGVLAAVIGGGLVPIPASATEPATVTDFTALVNPFVSTEDDFGQDLPGAEAPNSIVKINPLTTGARSHSGYDYAEDQIAGFTHTNLNGVGGSGGGGDLLVVPTYVTYTNRPSTDSYAKTYSHDAEDAEPGYYGVELGTTTGADGAVTVDEGSAPILAEATTDVRTGQDRFTFPQAGNASLVVDLRNNFTRRNAATIDVVTLEDGRVALSGEFAGHFNGYDYRLHYYAETTAVASGVRTWNGSGALGEAAHQDGTDVGAIVDFDVAAGDQVGLKVAISPISAEQARTDLGAEMGARTFEQVRADTSAAWEAILGRLAVSASDISDPDGELQTLFYTHLYRMFGMPMNATSTSGTYRGLDGQVHTADGYTHYDGWGFWDDFRKYEVLAIGYPEVFRDIAQSIVDLYGTFAASGKTSLAQVEHSVPTVRFERAAVVVADAVAKGAQLQGLADAWPALVSQSQGGYANADNVKRGYIANEVDDTLGTAYDDWAMATIAGSLGKDDEADAYRLRAANWTHLYKDDAVTLADGSTNGLIIPKNADGAWVDADPERFEAGNVYQGTLWQYNWYTAGDMGGMIDLMGGEDRALAALSFMFGEQAPDDGRRMLHANANEIDLHAPYLFNYVGAPSKTQYWVRNIYTKETWNRYIATGSTGEMPSGGGEFTPPIKTKVFSNSPQGFLPTMDNDTGTMSSTFVAAALGLFPVAAGSNEYQIGTPFFENVRISYASGRTFDIAASGVSPDDFYVQSATLNGQDFNRTWITYDQLTAGGSLSFAMDDQPSSWGADGVAPSSLSDELPTSIYEPIGAISLDSREFSEAVAGDGSITDSIAVTLANGTFAGANGADLAAAGAISAANVPAGLTLVAERTGDRGVALRLTGTAEQSGTLDSIDDLVVQISDAAFSRLPSTGAREFALKVTFSGVSLHAATTRIVAAADGSLDATVALTLSGAGFAGADGRDFVAEGLVTLPGLPSGVSATATKRDASTLDLHLSGSLGDAQRASFALAFTDAAFTGAVASELRGDGVSGLGTLTLVLDAQLRAKLQTLMTDAELVVHGEYSDESFAEFVVARDAAHVALDDASATDEQLLEAREALARAAGALSIAASDQIIEPVRVQAEEYSSDNGNGLKKEGVSPTGNVGGTWDGGELTYQQVSLGAAPLGTLTVRTSTRDERVGANPRLEFYLDEKTEASKVATVALPKTGGWSNYVTTTVDLDGQVSGDHTLIVVMHADAIDGQEFNYVSNLDWYEFAPVVVEQPVVDRTGLETAIDDTQALLPDEQRYVSIDFAVFRAALTSATRVLADAAATQSDVDEAQRVLEIAGSQLDWAVVRRLPLLIAQAEAIDEALYTTASIATLASALDAAKALPGGASHEAFVTAVDDLAAALAGLVMPDITAPVLVAPADGSVVYGTEFDPLDGVTAADHIDGDLTGEIVVSGAVDSGALGEYTLTYTVTDAAGNETSKQRLVTVVPAALTTATPTISGAVKVGAKVTAEPGSWTDGTNFTYQWLRDGSPIKGATKANYKLVPADGGHRISVTVSGVLTGYTSASATSLMQVVATK